MAETNTATPAPDLASYFSDAPLDLSRAAPTPELLAKWEHEVAELRNLARDDAARALADATDPGVEPVPMFMRLPFERAKRWVVLDSRKLPSTPPAAP
jgi:hypothetical protein